MQKFKLTPLEKSWVLYDIGNSAFTLLVTAMLPIYFNALAGSSGLDENLTSAIGAMQAPLPPFWLPLSPPSAAPWRTGNSRSRSSC